MSPRGGASTGIHALPLPGHTPGHMGVLIADSSDGLLNWGDIVHSRIYRCRIRIGR